MKFNWFKKFIFILILIAALACIGLGLYRAWDAFTAFDETILQEKDSQIYSLLRSEDLNLENSMDSFVREANTFFARARLKTLRQAWTESEDKDTAALEAYFAENTIVGNPVYADALMLYKDKITVSATGSKDYEFLTEADENGIRICVDGTGRYYLAYEVKETKNISYEAIMDLEQLYLNTLGQNPSGSLMLIDSTSTLMIARPSGDVLIAAAGSDADENTARCRDYMLGCQGSGSSGGASLQLTDDNGGSYAARMVVIVSDDTVNGEFALGISANYEEVIKPSRDAAEKILLYGGMVIAGVLVIAFMLIFMRRVNNANRLELAALRKKNETMEEINQNMLALTHHQRLETIGTMTASIAHDFNNLLTPIMGYSMMSMEMLPDDQTEIQEYLMEVYNASVKAKDIVSRLAELSKKGNEENFVSLDPDEVIRSSLKVTLPAKPKNVEVKIRLRSAGRRLRGDRTQLSQLVINIVLNAYDAMREKGGTLFVSTGIEDGRIVLKFRDTGEGMDSETVARIFDPFYTTKESGKGTGLGLAIVAQIAETHGGKVYVDSEKGSGTEFRITFPMLDKNGGSDKSKTIQINMSDLKL